MGVITVGSHDAEAGPDSTTQLVLTHQPGNAIASMSMAGPSQGLLNARTAISLAAVLVDAPDLLQQLDILPGAWARLERAIDPIIVTAARDFKGLTQPAQGIGCFHGFDPLISLLDGSERMPNVFFKISRCWRRCSFSRCSLAI